MPDARVAIVGSESLLGRELRELLEGTAPDVSVTLIGSEEASGVLTESGEEPVFIQPLRIERLAGIDLLFLAGDEASARKAFELTEALKPRPQVVDLSSTLEDHPRARLRAPMAETHTPAAAEVHLIAHPAATALAMLFGRMASRFRVERSVVLIFEPVSERGQRGIDELQQQTVSLLSFKKVPTEVFDAQLSFNMLPRFGTEALPALEEYETRIERHLATLLAPLSAIPMPSLKLVQAPVFHGYSASLWIEFSAAVEAGALAGTLGSVHVEVRERGEEPASNVGAAGQSGITVSVEPDRNNPRACWLWLVCDNLHLAAENAWMAGKELIQNR
jgi:aspartate-semialdehyde dehydrogenase